MNVIIERQSPDWGSPSFDAEEAARLLAAQFYGKSEEGLQYAAYTRELHNLWASCFSTSLSSCRKFLRDLAHQNWHQVAKCNAIYTEPQHSYVSRNVFGKDEGWILFTDDDDWFCPKAFVRLEEIRTRSSSNCIIWNRIRFDGGLETTPLIPTAEHPLYTYTNNYALRANTFKSGTDVAGVMQHGYANTMVERKIWSVFFTDNLTLSVTNKSPCSWNYLHKAKQSDNSKQALLQSVKHYAWNSIDSYGELSWAQPYVEASQKFFRKILSEYTLK